MWRALSTFTWRRWLTLALRGFGPSLQDSISCTLCSTQLMLYEVFRLLDDGSTQLLGCYPTEQEAQEAYEYYSEVRYPNAYVDINFPSEQEWTFHNLLHISPPLERFNSGLFKKPETKAGWSAHVPMCLTPMLPLLLHGQKVETQIGQGPWPLWMVKPKQSFIKPLKERLWWKTSG